MHPPHGPLKIGSNRQVTIPAELLRSIRLSPGDSVYLSVSDEVDGALVVIPVEKLVGWIDEARRNRPSTPAEEMRDRRPGD